MFQLRLRLLHIYIYPCAKFHKSVPKLFILIANRELITSFEVLFASDQDDSNETRTVLDEILLQLILRHSIKWC